MPRGERRAGAVPRERIPGIRRRLDLPRLNSLVSVPNVIPERQPLFCRLQGRQGVTPSRTPTPLTPSEYQDEIGQAACKPCLEGHFCSGNYSSTPDSTVIHLSTEVPFLLSCVPLSTFWTRWAALLKGTLCPAPQALHLKPYNLHSEPYAVHSIYSEPQTHNAEPKFSHPEPKVQHPEPKRRWIPRAYASARSGTSAPPGRGRQSRVPRGASQRWRAWRSAPPALQASSATPPVSSPTPSPISRQ